MDDEAKAAYEADVQKKPTYHDGTPRKPWEKLPEWVRCTWRIKTNTNG